MGKDEFAIEVSNRNSGERRSGHELSDLVATLMKKDNREAILRYIESATSLKDRKNAELLNHLMKLVTYIQIRDASPADILKGMMSSFMSTDAGELINSPLEVAMNGISRKTEPQLAEEILDIPAFWTSNNDLLAQKTLARANKSKKYDALGVKFGSADGQEQSFLFWNKDEIISSPLFVDLTSIMLK